MAGMLTTRWDEVAREINMLPMIDVLLVLVIICFLMQRILTWIPAQVPTPAPPGKGLAGPGSSRQIVLELRGDGTVAINRQPVPHAQLEEQLRAIFDGRPTKLLFIQASDERPYDEVIQVMDLARGAGVQVLAWTPRPGR